MEARNSAELPVSCPSQPADAGSHADGEQAPGSLQTSRVHVEMGGGGAQAARQLGVRVHAGVCAALSGRFQNRSAEQAVLTRMKRQLRSHEELGCVCVCKR